MDLHDLDVRIDNAGQLPSQINFELAKLIDAGKLNQSDAAGVFAPLRELSGALQSIQAWSTAAQTKAKPDSGLPPGFAIGDAGSSDEGTYTGTLDPDNVTLPQWAFYAQHTALWPYVGIIFTRKPVMRNAATGYVYTPGDLATTPPEAGPFAEWVQRVG